MRSTGSDECAVPTATELSAGATATATESAATVTEPTATAEPAEPALTGTEHTGEHTETSPHNWSDSRISSGAHVSRASASEAGLLGDCGCPRPDGGIVDTREKRTIDDVDSDSEPEDLKFAPGGYGERWRLLRPFMLRRRRRLPHGCLVPEPSVDHSC